MKKVIILGGGFAGISALKVLSRAKKNFELLLIDKKNTFDFLPALPDAIGQRISHSLLSFDFLSFCNRIGCKFINKEVININLTTRTLEMSSESITYDYILLSSGTQTNFYDNQNIKSFSYKVDTVSDAKKILKALKEGSFDSFIIAGGGYTGIEVATNIRRYYGLKKTEKKIIIIEKTKNIVNSLPKWISDYLMINLRLLDIEVFFDTYVREVTKDALVLSNGQIFEKAVLIWTAGVKASDYVFRTDIDKINQGRLRVDEYLKLNDRCFAAGDIAAFFKDGKPLRMAVQFALSQGNIAAKNIINSILGRPLEKYRPIDLGYIIPIANNKACGIVMGVKVKGIIATVLHYLMSIYRLYGLGNKLGFIRSLLRGGAS